MGEAQRFDRRASQLFDEGAQILERLWDGDVSMVRDHEREQFHSPRNTLAFCHVLLARGEAVRAERAIAAVLALQETHPGDGHYGNFRWYLEDQSVTDLNAVEFVLDDLIGIVREHRDALTPAIVAAAESAIVLGLEEIARLDVHLSYTNIALSDIANSVLGGELIHEDRFARRGAARLETWLAITGLSGMPHEFNSPTYLAVDILRMASLAEGTVDPAIAAKAPSIRRSPRRRVRRNRCCGATSPRITIRAWHSSPGRTRARTSTDGAERPGSSNSCSGACSAMIRFAERARTRREAARKGTSRSPSRRCIARTTRYARSAARSSRSSSGNGPRLGGRWRSPPT